MTDEPDVYDSIAELIRQNYGASAGPRPWREFFGEIPAEALMAAVAAWVAAEARRPTVADIRSLLAGGRNTAPWEASQEVFLSAAFPSGDPAQEPLWEDPAIGDAVRAMGGWRNICETWQTKDRGTNIAQWREAYKAAWARRRQSAKRQVAEGLAGPSFPELPPKEAGRA